MEVRLPENFIVESGLGFTTLRLARGSSSSESEHVRSTTFSFDFSSFVLSVDDVAVVPELTTSKRQNRRLLETYYYLF